MSKLHNYKNYKEYVDIQTRTNKRKEKYVWCTEPSIIRLATYVDSNNLKCAHIICHGTRNGAELTYFKKHLKPLEIIGTEISDTATKYKNTIQWDFHNLKPEWKKHFDILYSNSLDHSYKPQTCIDMWMTCVKSTGIMIIEWSTGHLPSAASKTDPFGATFKVIEGLLQKKYVIKDVIKFNDIKDRRFYIVVHPDFVHSN